MGTQIIQTGSTTRVIIDPRSITDTTINSAGHLIVSFSDGTTKDAGLVGVIGNTTTNTASNSMLSGVQVSGFLAAAQQIANQLNALGV